jgi:DNA polymerase elongation subunit (family B)
VMAFLRQQIKSLRGGRVPLEKLLVTQKLSRELALYRTPSPPARAAAQLAAEGKTMRAGQAVRFVYTRGAPGVHAWDLAEPLEARRVDVGRYRTLLIRAAQAVLGPLGVEEEQLGFSLTQTTNYPLSAPGTLMLNASNRSKCFRSKV